MDGGAMRLPAPSPLAARPTVALGCTGLHFPADAVHTARENGVAPVFMHRLTGEDGSGDDGPREMLEATATALEKSGHTTAWGAGCTVRTEAEAAAFATGGYTWFSFALSGEMDSRADTMSLGELDAAIVALEDSGCLAAEWHANYTDREWPLASGRTLRLTDETLARTAVKSGRALAHAAQLQQAIRTLWSGRGVAPDIELCFAGTRDRWSEEEFLFLALESARSGIAPVCIAPPLGPAWQRGAKFDGDENAHAAMLGGFGEIAALIGTLKIGIHHAAGKPVRPLVPVPQREQKETPSSPIAAALCGRAHPDFTEDAWLATLDVLARTQPEVFRRWLIAAQEQFPFAANGMALSITEEEIHVLPQVSDADLAPIFLGDVRGRQLLLATYPDVLRSDRTLREAIRH